MIIEIIENLIALYSSIEIHSPLWISSTMKVFTPFSHKALYIWLAKPL